VLANAFTYAKRMHNSWSFCRLGKKTSIRLTARRVAQTSALGRAGQPIGCQSPRRTIGSIDLIRRQQPTGTFCAGNHPEQIEYRYALVDGVEVPDGESSPRCFRAGCPDNELARAKEQQRAGG
jgi:hypothetical protein